MKQKNLYIPKFMISDLIRRKTGYEIDPSKIDFITVDAISSAVIAYDQNIIDKDKFDRIITFNFNNIFEREGLLIHYIPNTEYKFKNIKFKVFLNYN